MNKQNRVTLGLLTAAFPILAMAAPVHLLPGAWRVQMAMPNIPGMPAQAMAMMNREMPEVCVRPNSNHPPLSPQARAEDCHVLHSSTVGDRMTAVMACQIAGHLTHYEVVMDIAPDRKSFVEHTQILQGPGAGMGATTLRGTWVSPSCAKIAAPGELSAYSADR